LPTLLSGTSLKFFYRNRKNIRPTIYFFIKIEIISDLSDIFIFKRENQMSRQNSDLSDLDRKILRVLQNEANLPLDQIAAKVGASRTAVWNRIKKFEASGLIIRYQTLLDPELAGLGQTFFVMVSTNQHDKSWLERFSAAIKDMPEIVEAHRLAGDIDYILKVQVATARDYDQFYRRLIERIELYKVTSQLSMETLKTSAPLPL
jgi:Lrp/AsnC family transcriptional regulator